MKVLLDTNILIHREASKVVRQDIGKLFWWLDKLKCQKTVFPGSMDEIRKHADPEVVSTFETKIESYDVLKTIAPATPEIKAILAEDSDENSKLDTAILNELHNGRIDIVVSEDRGIHRKAAQLGLTPSVFTIEGFLEKSIAENPGLTDYKVLAVKKSYFGEINLKDPFFDSFREDYKGFEKWFNSKSNEVAYTCHHKSGDLVAFLYLKIEKPGEDYSNINPAFDNKKRLKIGTLKVVANGFKLGERFLKIAFDNALANDVDEIYVTIFNHNDDQERLIGLLQDWGFRQHGAKTSSSGEELVLVKPFAPTVSGDDPKLHYPYISAKARKFIVPIYPKYHTELLPDSILNNESPKDFVENRPNRNAISKVYVGRSTERDLHPGDIIIFYRTKTPDGPAHYTSVTTTIGVVQEVFPNPATLEEFIKLSRKRSIFSDAQLKEHWDYYPALKPFVVNFLYVYSFPKRVNLSTLKENGIIEDVPRGFERMTDEAFTKLLEISNANRRLIVN